MGALELWAKIELLGLAFGFIVAVIVWGIYGIVRLIGWFKRKEGGMDA